MAVDRPAILPAARMYTRRCEHVTALAAHINTRSDLSCGIADGRFRLPLEIQMAAACGDGLDNGRQFAKFALKLSQFDFGV